MKNFISKLISSFLTVAVLSAALTVQAAEGPAASPQATSSTSLIPSKTRIACYVSAATVVGGLVKFGWTWWSNRSMSNSIQAQLQAATGASEGSLGVKLQGWRISNAKQDNMFWTTAASILKDRENVVAALQKDTFGDRIIIGRAAESEATERDDNPELTIFKTIQTDLQDELNTVRISIRRLSRYTDVRNLIVELINNPPAVIAESAASSEDGAASRGSTSDGGSVASWQTGLNGRKIERFRNQLEQFSEIFAALNEQQLNTFENAIQERLQGRWFKWLSPSYVDLGLEYWELVKRYTRLSALKVVVDGQIDRLMQPDVDEY